MVTMSNETEAVPGSQAIVQQRFNQVKFKISAPVLMFCWHVFSFLFVWFYFLVTILFIHSAECQKSLLFQSWLIPLADHGKVEISCSFTDESFGKQ